MPNTEVKPLASMVVGNLRPARVERCQAILIHSSSVVELSAVNRSVVGSSPTWPWPGQGLRHRPFTAVTRVRVP